MSDTTPPKNLSPEHDDKDSSIVVPTDEDGNPPADGSRKDIIKKLREDLKKCTAEKQEYLAGWQRAKADFINARKEDEKNRGEFAKFARETLIIELLPVLDNFDLAMENQEIWERTDKNWRDGVEYIYKTLTGILKDHGLRILDPLGDQYDPKLHEGVATILTEIPEEDGVITKVMRRGYFLNEKLIRPAHVEYKEYSEKSGFASSEKN